MNVFWDIGQFFMGGLQVFVNALNLLLIWLPNPDPFRGIIESLDVVTNQEFSLMAFWWIDQAFDLFFVSGLLNSLIVLLIVSIPILFVIRAVVSLLGVGK